jgi:hypothetical protein
MDFNEQENITLSFQLGNILLIPAKQ